MKRIVSLILSLTLLLSICSLTTEMGKALSVEQYFANEYNANTYHTNLVMYCEENGYPTHYGGAYINQNSGHLVINLVSRSDSIENFYYDICDAEYLEFRVVEYSMNELTDIVKQASSYMEMSEGERPVNITGSSIIQKNNQVEIYTDSVSRSLNSDIYSLFNSPAVVVKHFDGVLELQSSGRPGEYISNGSQGASMGYLATYTHDGITETGFVTAGHAFVGSKTTAYNESGVALGDKTFRAGPPGTSGILDTGDIDVTFIKLRPGITLDRTIAGTSIIQDNVPVIPGEGSVIYRSGAETGVQSGTVISTHFVNGSISDDYETTIRRMLLSNPSDPGDSGGILYTNPQNNKAKVAGIHQAGGEINGIDRSVGIFAAKIVNADADYGGYILVR